MTIIGVDPGTLITGYGIIEAGPHGLRLLACDAIRNDSHAPLASRLKIIYDRLGVMIDKHRPDELALETAFYGKNAQSALKLGHARGVAMLAAVTRDLPVREYSPREVKKAVVGNGTASKEQVRYMVRSLLRLRRTPAVYDITDALAVAICHFHRRSPAKKGAKSWKAFVAAHPERVASASEVAP